MTRIKLLTEAESPRSPPLPQSIMVPNTETCHDHILSIHHASDTEVTTVHQICDSCQKLTCVSWGEGGHITKSVSPAHSWQTHYMEPMTPLLGTISSASLCWHFSKLHCCCLSVNSCHTFVVPETYLCHIFNFCRPSVIWQDIPFIIKATQKWVASYLVNLPSTDITIKHWNPSQKPILKDF